MQLWRLAALSCLSLAVGCASTNPTSSPASPDSSAAPPSDSASAAPGTATAHASESGAPPKAPGGSTARSRLAALRVAPENDGDDYDREKFPHWSSHANGCDTRELVLKRDGDGIRTSDDCYPSRGKWTSPYDGATWTKPADVDIDHMVPLAEAWQSGANDWTQDQRERFANDLEHPQLWAVTDNVNQQKSDQDPAEWKPTRTAFWCTYARSWVEVKHVHRLSVDPAEKKALDAMLDRC